MAIGISPIIIALKHMKKKIRTIKKKTFMNAFKKIIIRE
jgi:hypothetical protein